VRPRPPHLCRYALIFHETPEFVQRWSRFWSGLVTEAGLINERGTRQVPIFYGIDGHRDTEDYQRLVADIRRDRFAGLVFTTVPATGLLRHRS
jgi:hypothetical protein